MLSRSLSDCQSLILNAMIQVSFWQTDGFWDQRWMVEHPRFKDEKVTMVVKIIMASWFAQMSDFGLFCWWNDWRPEMHHTSSSLSKTVTHLRWWTPLFSCRRRASCFLARFLSGTFLSGSLNWARFPLLSNSSPLLSAFLSGPLNWALFWAKLLNWALFWANPLVWALFWALKWGNLLSRALFWVVLLFWALFWALKKALKLSQNLYGWGGVNWTVIDKNDDSDDEFVMGWV